jgi:glyoxylase-like metal-dependent hydrolase (beta-lactamase superfamily II)
MPLRLGDPIDPRLPWIRKLHDLDTARASLGAGVRQSAVESAGRALGDRLREGAKVVSVRTLPTTDAPYPIRFAFNGTVPAIAPGALLMIQNRSLLVQVRTENGLKNVLFNPTDGPANLATPFFERLVARVPALLRRALQPPPNRCAEHLAELGLSCADIDVIAFDHFHTQDIRPLLGSAELAARFPNAFLLAPRVEWDDWDHLPMMQRAWFVPDGKKGVPETRVVLTQDDMVLGEGALLLRTPGHTSGNQTLFAHADGGVFGCSENGTCADNWSPHRSRLPGLRSAAKQLDLEVVLNANTPELAAEQYTSMLLERAMVDRVKDDSGFYRMFPSSEVTHSLIAPHVRPTYRFGKMESGSVEVRSRAANTTQLRTAAAE